MHFYFSHFPSLIRGGKICLTDHFKPLWARNVPKFGIAHAMALGVSFLPSFLPSFQNSWFGFGSSFPDYGSVQVCIFLTINVVKTDILSGKSYKI